LRETLEQLLQPELKAAEDRLRSLIGRFARKRQRNLTVTLNSRHVLLAVPGRLSRRQKPGELESLSAPSVRRLGSRPETSHSDWIGLIQFREVALLGNRMRVAGAQQPAWTHT
jgi:hypothetical protein